MPQNKSANELFHLEVRNIKKYFPGVIALDDVSIKIKSGEVHGLVGKNGAGKSTLIKIISGLYTPDEGTIIFEGQRYDHLTPSEARLLGIQVVPQEQQFQPFLTVAENLFVGSWPTTGSGFINFREIKQKARESLEKLNINIPVERLAKDLPLVQRQIIAIARAIFLNSKLIILDEPTHSLTSNETDLLFNFVHELAKKGITFIYISHYLNEVFEICDSVSVLRNGHLVHNGPVKEINGSRLVELMVGKVVDNALQRKSSVAEKKFEFKNLSSYGRFFDISFSIGKGEILGLTGLMGCGSFELAKSLFGLYPLESGEIFIEEQPVSITSPEDAFKNGIAFLPEDRRTLGLVVMLPVDANINLSTLDKVTNKLGFINERSYKEIAKKYIQLLGISTPTMIQEVRFLSGGNQQKVVVSRLLNTNPKLMVMLDPTAGIDVEAKSEIHKFMDDLTKQGMSILLLSTDMNELLALSDRVLVMHQGQLVKEFTHQDATRQKILEASEGIKERIS